ncbi:hypothetical protein ACHAXR_004334, partial [Thalassiosira sp. AJA248-18]
DVMWEDGKIKKGRFKAVLADFGFARATSTADYGQKEQTKRGKMNRHQSRIMFRAKSAVGTKHFAAPEIVGSVRDRRGSEIALTKCVSSYALISDAYAVGATLSEITTGVPPGQDAQTYVDKNRRIKMPKKQNSISKLKRKLSRQFSSSSDHHTYDIQLRHMHELPELAADLITSLMMENVDERLSVREAQDHEWIGGYDTLAHGDVPSRHDDPMVFIRNEKALM